MDIDYSKVQNDVYLSICTKYPNAANYPELKTYLKTCDEFYKYHDAIDYEENIGTIEYQKEVEQVEFWKNNYCESLRELKNINYTNKLEYYKDFMYNSYGMIVSSITIKYFKSKLSNSEAELNDSDENNNKSQKSDNVVRYSERQYALTYKLLVDKGKFEKLINENGKLKKNEIKETGKKLFRLVTTAHEFYTQYSNYCGDEKNGKFNPSVDEIKTAKDIESKIFNTNYLQ